MNRFTIKSKYPFLKESKFIGSGFNGYCFKKNDKVYKIFSSKPRNFDENSSYLTSINLKNFYNPKELLIDKEEIIGYVADYCHGKNITRIPKYLTSHDFRILFDDLCTLVDQVTANKIQLVDLHSKNIIFNDSFNIIDVDRCFYNDTISYESLLKVNRRILNKAIIYTLFNLYDNEEITFEDKQTRSLYSDLIFSDYDLIDNFFDIIYLKRDSLEPVNKVAARVKFKKSFDEYRSIL